MTITVCIPAYRAEAFIGRTLRSVAEQTFGDFQVHIAIDPADSETADSPNKTLRACQPFLKDPRFRAWVNPQRLGWAGNARGLLQRVTTSHFTLLPHDDIWHPRYLEDLFAALASNPGAVVAYSDLISFGAAQRFRKDVRIPRGADRDAQSLALFLEGWQALPWRGVTRSEILPDIDYFPIDAYMGYASEYEFAWALVDAGPVLHVPQSLYFKRLFPPKTFSASAERRETIDQTARARAWQEHAERMRARLAARAGAASAPLCLAMETALLRRRQIDLGLELPNELVDLAEDGLRQSKALPEPAPIAARFEYALSRHLAGTGDNAGALHRAKQAVTLDEDFYEGELWVARALLRNQREFDAIPHAERAARLRPHGPELTWLFEQITQAIAK